MPNSTTHKRPWLGQVLKVLVPMIVTVGLCWLMMHHIDFGEMMRIIHTQCDFRWMALALCVGACAHFFRAWRWGIQLDALGVRTPGRVLVYSIFGTYAINLLFPRLGEVWRSGYVSNRQHADFATVFGSMVAERLSDTVVVLLLLVLSGSLAANHIADYLMQNRELYDRSMGVATSPWLWLAIAACAALAWWFITRKSKAGSLMARLQKFVHGLWQGFASIATMPHKGRWLLLTLCLWGCYLSSMVIAFMAFPFTREAMSQHGLIAPLVAFVLSSVAMGVPSNGGFGPWQWGVIFALDVYGVEVMNASAFANLFKSLDTLVIIGLGIIAFVAIILDRKKSPSHPASPNNPKQSHLSLIKQ